MGQINGTDVPISMPEPDQDTNQPVRVAVSSIMDEIHQHWASLMAGQVQRNAELSAAVTALTAELAEAKGTVAAIKAAHGLE